MLSDFQVLVEKAVRDDSLLITAGDIDTAIKLAVDRYSLDRPQYKVVDIAANGTATLALPVGFELGFSAISSMEYPIGSFPAEIIETDQYAFYQTPTGFVLRLAFVPGGAVRLTFSVVHVLTALVDTLPVNHREAVCCWAAAYCYDQLAGFYAGQSDSTLSADKVERGSQSRDYAARALTLRKRYLNELGIEDKKAAPAGVVVDLDLRSSWGGNRLTHSNRFR